MLAATRGRKQQNIIIKHLSPVRWRVQILALALTSSVTLGKFLKLSLPVSLHLRKGADGNHGDDDLPDGDGEVYGTVTQTAHCSRLLLRVLGQQEPCLWM